MRPNKREVRLVVDRWLSTLSKWDCNYDIYSTDINRLINCIMTLFHKHEGDKSSSRS